MDKADGVIQAVVIVLGIGALAVACSFFKVRERANILSPEELDEIRIRRESAKEVCVCVCEIPINYGRPNGPNDKMYYDCSMILKTMCMTRYILWKHCYLISVYCCFVVYFGS